MAVDKDNILVGVGSCVVNSINVGGTRGGLTLVRDAEYLKVDNIDQQPGILKVKKMREEYNVKFAMAEATLENIKAALELQSSITGTDPKVLNFGGDVDGSEIQIEIYGMSPGDFQRKVTLFKCRSIEVGEVAFKRDDVTVVEVTFCCVNDTTKAAGAQIGKFEDSTT